MSIEILDPEMKGFEVSFKEAITFDIVSPIEIIGAAGLHYIDINAKMTNGDNIYYHYRENPGNGRVTQYIEINGKIEEPGIEVDPAIFAKSEYELHLARLIKRKV